MSPINVKEYQYSVSRDGVFLFRTEWNDFHNLHIGGVMAEQFPVDKGFKVVLNTRDASYTSVQVN